MDELFVVEKAIRPVDGRVTWLVLDDDLDPVDQVTQFALYLEVAVLARTRFGPMFRGSLAS